MDAATGEPCAMPVRAGHFVDGYVERVVFFADFERLAPVGPKVFSGFVGGVGGSGGTARVGSGGGIREGGPVGRWRDGVGD